MLYNENHYEASGHFQLWQCNENPNRLRRMSSRKRIDESTLPQIARRMRLLRIAMAGSDNGAQAAFARGVGLAPQNWNKYEGKSPERIGLDSAIKVVKRWPDVSLDWIYFGNTRGMLHETMVKLEAADILLRQLEAEEAEAEETPATRHVGKARR